MKPNKLSQLFLKRKKMFKTAYLISQPADHIVMVGVTPFAAIQAINMPQPFSVETFEGDVYLIDNTEHSEPRPIHNAAYFSPNTDIVITTGSINFIGGRPDPRR